MAAAKVKTKAKTKANTKTKAKSTVAKKSTTAAVKISKKKSSKKSITRSFTTDNVFYLNNGLVISNLKDLPKVLKDMDDATYYSHVNESKNDFSAWISDVFGMSKLAMKIGEIKDRSDLISTIKKGL